MRSLILLLFCSSLFATELDPWFSPLWEAQGRLAFWYKRDDAVQSPKGNFSNPCDTYTAFGSLGLTPWPYWNTEVELLLTRSHPIPFSYEASLLTIRYQWRDDIRGDPFALTTGVTLSLPAHRYLHNLCFLYHGEINAEGHLSVGKEWRRMRMWALCGYGIANRGSGWTHGRAALSFDCSCFEWGTYSELFIGLGQDDLNANTPFPGYASVAYRALNLASFLDIRLSYFGTLSFLGWVNVYAHNFVKNSWSARATLLIPFSL